MNKFRILDRVKLTPEELKYCQEIAKIRNTICISLGSTNRAPELDGLKIHETGCYSELGFKKIAGLVLILTYFTKKQKYAPDVTHLFKKYDVDIKGSLRHPDNIQLNIPVQQAENNKEGYYVLMSVQLPEIIYMGCISHKEAVNPEHWNTNMPRPCYVVKSDELNDFPECR